MEKVLIIGASGQIGTELTATLRDIHGPDNVIATDIKQSANPHLHSGPFELLDATDATAIASTVQRHGITQLYHLSALLSATGEKYPKMGWDLNMQSLLHVLEIARDCKLNKVFWPSSIAVFGPDAPKALCPQEQAQVPTTMYGISKSAGELWCKYYYDRYGVDVRSLRYPGLISWKSEPGGGTTDYAVAIYREAIRAKQYQCYLTEHTKLPMMYMPDAIRATLELMEAPAASIKQRTSYNLSAMSFSPKEIAAVIGMHIPSFTIDYAPDGRQAIADSWPGSIDDRAARWDWGWKEQFDLYAMTKDMLHHLTLHAKLSREELAVFN